jgi:ABC-2 type transport system permease protein
MLRNILTKTLFEKRWMTFWWSLITLLLIFGIVILFPLFKDSLSDLTNVPDSLKSLVGDATSYSTITGWLSFQVFDQMVFIGVILGIIIGGSMLAGEENEGTLQSLLALPVRRSSVYVQKFLAIAVIIGIVMFCLFLAAWAGVWAIGEVVDVSRLFVAASMAFLLSLFFTALTYALGAITGKRGLAGIVAGLFAFISFMITSLAAGISALRYPEYLSPFHYFNKPSPLEAGLQTADALVLAGATLVLLVIGFVVFIKRDIYRR